MKIRKSTLDLILLGLAFIAALKLVNIIEQL
jgi:hypothetical protein